MSLNIEILTPANRMSVRFVPSDPIFFESTSHVIAGTAVQCLRKYGLCPACQKHAYYQESYEKTQDPEDLQNANANKTFDRFLYVVVVRGCESEGPKVLLVGNPLHDIIQEGFIKYPLPKSRLPSEVFWRRWTRKPSVTDWKTGVDFEFIADPTIVKSYKQFHFSHYAKFAGSITCWKTFRQWCNIRPEYNKCIPYVGVDEMRALMAKDDQVKKSLSA